MVGWLGGADERRVTEAGMNLSQREQWMGRGVGRREGDWSGEDVR